MSFNPRRPRGRRTPPAPGAIGCCFNPRRPRGRRRPVLQALGVWGFNPRRPRGRRPALQAAMVRSLEVSIHAARAGGDAAPAVIYWHDRLFQSTPPARAATACSRQKAEQAVSIHAARAGGDRGEPAPNCYVLLFQSTPPARAATAGSSSDSLDSMCFNPRRPRGRRLVRCNCIRRAEWVSIHAARAGGDVRTSLPVSIIASVSIHAARAGGDRRDMSAAGMRCGVSIHAARAGGDVAVDDGIPLWHVGFNPRRPRGRRRPCMRTALRHLAKVSIHAARAGGDRSLAQPCRHYVHSVSIHAARAGGDSETRMIKASRPDVSIHAARAGGDRADSGNAPSTV